MRPRLLFAHGWALDRSLWNAVLAELGEDGARAVTLDAGYFGHPAASGSLDGAPLLGVGQSLGALELLADPPAPLRGLVAIDGFARFVAGPDFPQGHPRRVLQHMARRLQAAPGPVVSEFLGKALGAAALPSGAPDAQALARGLERLASLDGRAAAARLPVWRLHASDDPIAPLNMADASFADAVQGRRVRVAADHLSPLSAPQACAEVIRQALHDLSVEASPP